MNWKKTLVDNESGQFHDLESQQKYTALRRMPKIQQIVAKGATAVCDEIPIPEELVNEVAREYKLRATSVIALSTGYTNLRPADELTQNHLYQESGEFQPKDINTIEAIEALRALDASHRPYEPVRRPTQLLDDGKIVEAIIKWNRLSSSNKETHGFAWETLLQDRLNSILSLGEATAVTVFDKLEASVPREGQKTLLDILGMERVLTLPGPIRDKLIRRSLIVRGSSSTRDRKVFDKVGEDGVNQHKPSADSFTVFATRLIKLGVIGSNKQKDEVFFRDLIMESLSSVGITPTEALLSSLENEEFYSEIQVKKSRYISAFITETAQSLIDEELFVRADAFIQSILESRLFSKEFHVLLPNPEQALLSYIENLDATNQLDDLPASKKEQLRVAKERLLKKPAPSPLEQD